MEAFKIFSHEELGSVRTLEKDGELLFAAPDICKCLEIANPSQKIATLDDDEIMTLCLNEGHSGSRGGAQKMNFVTESGMYSIVLSSRKPSAKEFKRWITHEVIPSIRKHGGYIFGQEDTAPDLQEQLHSQIDALASKIMPKENRSTFFGFVHPPMANDFVIGPDGLVMTRGEAANWDYE